MPVGTVQAGAQLPRASGRLRRPTGMVPGFPGVSQVVRHIDHIVTRRLLDAYADEELSAERRSRVAVHLGCCEHCRRQLEMTERIKGHLAWRRIADRHALS